VQNHLRELLRSELGFGLSQIGDRLDLLVAFSGMSESGKSSHAEHLRCEHHFCRLKLKHFVANLTREGVPASAIEVALELLRYLSDHYYLDRVSIESLHAPYLPALLKRLLGERLRIVYICAPPETRVRRSMAQHGLSEVEASAEVAEKDHRKVSCGVEQIRAIADIVWDNSRDDEYASTTALARRLVLAAS
jgi:dephospho-CoA kinase